MLRIRSNPDLNQNLIYFAKYKLVIVPFIDPRIQLIIIPISQLTSIVLED